MAEVENAIQAVFRIESARLVAGLVRLVRDVGAAEELSQDALLCALEHWPKAGIPKSPGAWLMATARRRAIDRLRRQRWLEGRRIELEATLGEGVTPPSASDEGGGDDLLRLVLIACHPVLSLEARVALTLRLMGGLTTFEIARAFLVSEPTISQRIVRAKRALSSSRVPFEVPRGEALALRLAAVMQVIYLVFNEGYAATAGDAWMRPALCEDALRLGRVLAELAPLESEVHGLVALLELQASRLGARRGAGGKPVLLLDQRRSGWDPILIRRGLSAISRAEALGGPPGPYLLQASIAACHARARTAAETDWSRIAALYEALAILAPSPVVELNRAVAVSMAFGPVAGLKLVEALAGEPSLRGYQLLPAVRGDLLERLGRTEEARTELSRAAGLARNGAERALLEERVARLSSFAPPARGAPFRSP